MTKNRNKEQMMEDIINEINQLLHNNGIPKQSRINYIINLLNVNHSEENVIKKLLERIKIQNNHNPEFMQKLYMLLGEKCIKQDLDQYYTPINISKFIKNVLLIKDDSRLLEPASGTGDLAILLENAFIDFVDISPEVTKLLKINLNLRGFKEEKYSITTEDSLKCYKKEKLYDFCLLNPPFGKKSVLDDISTLKNYKLGDKKTKVELGKLFIEYSLERLNKNGILIAIIPSGYLTNQSCKDLRELIINNYRIIGVIELPEQTFKQSGTGVDTSIIIIENIKLENYNIFIEKLNNIKQLDEIINSFKCFAFKENIEKILKIDNNIKYHEMDINDIIKDKYKKINIKEYLLLRNIKKGNSFNLLDKIIKQKKTKNIDLNKEYIYLDIGQVNKGYYNIDNKIMGNKLPSRASYLVEENDIIVSKLKGKISFAIICNDFEKLIVSNGLIVLRFKEEIYRLNTLKYLFNNNFSEQLNSLTNGSIMASINENDFLEKIYIDKYNEEELNNIKEYINLQKKINSLKYNLII